MKIVFNEQALFPHKDPTKILEIEFEGDVTLPKISSKLYINSVVYRVV